jgi:serine/threonine protein kinase
VNLAARDLTGRCGQASVDITTQLGRGATATVHPARLNGQRYAAKIFHEDRAFPTAKIIAMLANPPKAIADGDGAGNVGRLAWPTAILSNDEGKDVGFLMPELDLKVAFPLDYFYDQTLFKKLKSPNEAALSFRLEIARNLSRLVADLHEQGHCFIDMKPQNIRVTLGSHEVCLLDCDGFSIAGPQGNIQLACLACGKKNRVPTARLCERPTCGGCGRFLLPDTPPSSTLTNVGNRFPAELLSTDYISPEAFRGNIPPSALGEDQDRYALAVLLFQLLNRGTHPFQGISLDSSMEVNTNDEKAALGLYPHGLLPHPKIKPRPQSIHEQFEDGLRVHFDESFKGNPSSRPSAKDWGHKIEQLLASKSLIRCENFPNDVAHIRFRDKQCPTCYLAAIPLVKSTPTKLGEIKPITESIQAHTHSQASNQKSTGWSNMILGVAIAAFILFILALYSSRNNSHSGTESTSVPKCQLSLASWTSKQLCETFWENKAPQCYVEILSEFERRQVDVAPSTCGLPRNSKKDNPAIQAPQFKYFSVFASDNRAVGWDIGSESQQIADIKARNECRSRSDIDDRNTCRKIISGQDLCIAIATSSNGALGASSGSSISVASSKALKTCKASGGDNCQIPTGGVICQ